MENNRNQEKNFYTYKFDLSKSYEKSGFKVSKGSEEKIEFPSRVGGLDNRVCHHHEIQGQIAGGTS
jgi:hypothetical protein